MLRPEDILNHLRKRPFEPFRVHLKDGTAYDIRHPELMLVGDRFIIVGLQRTGLNGLVIDSYETPALMHVVRLEPISVPKES